MIAAVANDLAFVIGGAVIAVVAIGGWVWYGLRGWIGPKR